MANNKKTAAEVLAEATEKLNAAKAALKEKPADEKLQADLTAAQTAFDEAEKAAAIENGTKADKDGKTKEVAPARKRSPLKKVEQPTLNANGKPKCLKKYPKENTPVQCRCCKWHKECKGQK